MSAFDVAAQRLHGSKKKQRKPEKASSEFERIDADVKKREREVELRALRCAAPNDSTRFMEFRIACDCV